MGHRRQESGDRQHNEPGTKHNERTMFLRSMLEDRELRADAVLVIQSFL
jgi:hypothetical protein